MKKNRFRVLSIAVISLILSGACGTTAHAFWIWTPKDKKIVNAKHVVKDTPEEQYNWAMKFYQEHEFQKAADEFNRMTSYFPDSHFSPDAQYYAGRSLEEIAKYYAAFQNYQKTIDNYPYTKRLDEIIERQFNIANSLENQKNPKFMEFELALSLEKAVEVYSKVVDNSPFGPYAEKALMNMADCYRRMQKYNDAMSAYEKIINDHPESPLVAEAKYQLAYTRYESSLNPEYDQESTDEALRQFKQLQASTPVPKVAEEANKVLTELKEKKADSMLKVAQFYERQGKKDSALIYYRRITEKYYNTKAADISEKRIEELTSKKGKKWGIF
ncbi:MAG: outer membrane protein assembly factor BamD [Candidatus Omnitrophica bacterium]|nr:outer membrane protein assembly factor BamD [Candidatus Omnitrophota bacterium]